MKSIAWFKDMNCELAINDPFEMFPYIYEVTKGNPCDGCNCKDECNLFRALDITREKILTEIATKEQFNSVKDGITNAQIAAVLGISKRKASKMRAAGEIDIAKIREGLNK